MRYSFIFVPVELGLEFLLTSRIKWLENELKIKTKPEIVKELKFDGVPETVLMGLNEKKFTLLDYVMLKLEMVLEGEQIFVVATEQVLGSSKTNVVRNLGETGGVLHRIPIFPEMFFVRSACG